MMARLQALDCSRFGTALPLASLAWRRVSPDFFFFRHDVFGCGVVAGTPIPALVPLGLASPGVADHLSVLGLAVPDELRGATATLVLVGLRPRVSSTRFFTMHRAPLRGWIRGVPDGIGMHPATRLLFGTLAKVTACQQLGPEPVPDAAAPIFRTEGA